MYFLFFISCAAEESAQKTPTSPQEYPYLVETEESLPEIDTVALAEHIESVLSRAVRYSSEIYIDKWSELLGGADSYCPRWFQNENGDNYFFDSCTSTDGSRFEGYGVDVIHREYEDEGGTSWVAKTAWGNGSITSSAGEKTLLNGGVNSMRGASQSGTHFYEHVQPGFSTSVSDDSWHADSPRHEIHAVKAVDGGHFVHMNGAYPTDIGFLLVESVVMTDTWGVQCLVEPSGTMSFYLPDVGWLDMELEGPRMEDLAADYPGCDGCVRLLRKGVDVGELCLDFTVLVGWNQSPFE